MATRHKVFVSFDYDHDRRYKYLLEAWDANPNFDFVFNDQTPGEINTSNLGRIKAGLTAKIRDATHTLVIVGRHANTAHPRRHLIGNTNWINWEIEQSYDEGNVLAAVKLDPSFAAPHELSGKMVSWALGFEERAIIRALEQA